MPLMTSETTIQDQQDNKSRRSSLACSGCRVRKVRCDVLQTGSPCTRCRADNFDCEVQARKKRRRVARAGSEANYRTTRHQPVLPTSSTPTEALAVTEPSVAGSSNSPLAVETETSNTQPLGSASPRILPRHIVIHQIPIVPFFLNFSKLFADPNKSVPSRDHQTPETIQAHENYGLETLNHFDLDDLRFLKQKGAFDIPEWDVMDFFIESYFGFFHPFFPIIDKTAFLHEYNQMRTQQNNNYHQMRTQQRNNYPGPSLLLLQAVFFIGSSTVDIEVLKKAGFASRQQARSRFHRRTRYLYDFDWERDVIVTIQALLLISHYYPSMVEQKHTWHWANQAITLAHTTGLHRVAANTPQRRLWTRIWWTCLVRDRVIGLGTGRPMQISSLDCSTPMLTMDDLNEVGDTEQDRAIKIMFIEFVKLCQYMEGVLSLQHSTVTISTGEVTQEQVMLCDETLQSWVDNLEPEAKCQEEPLDVTGRPNIATMYRALLHLMHRAVIIALHQPFHLQIGDDSAQWQPQQKVKNIALDATQLIVKLVNLDLVKYCPTIIVQSVIPVVIVHLMDIRASALVSEKNLHYNRFKMCMMFLHELGDIYWHATFYHDFFQLAATFDTSFDSISSAQITSKKQDKLMTFLKQQTGMRSRSPTRALLGNENVDTTPDQNLQQSSESYSYREPAIVAEMSIPDQDRNGNMAALFHSSSGNIVDESALLDGMRSGNYNDSTSLEEMSSDVFNLLANENRQFREWSRAHDNFQNFFVSA